MKIEISELLKAVEEILKQLKVDSVEIPEDAIYWDVRQSARYKYSDKPPTPDLKHLDKDWGELHEIAGAGDDKPAPALVPLANLLRAIGDNPSWTLP